MYHSLNFLSTKDKRETIFPNLVISARKTFTFEHKERIVTGKKELWQRKAKFLRRKKYSLSWSPMRDQKLLELFSF